MGAVFDPHQLDFDWRFSSTSVFAISEHIPFGQNLLLIGCPSLVPMAEARNATGILIERNPYHSHSTSFLTLRTDVRFHKPRAKLKNSFDVTVFDAPWYPAEFMRWVNLAVSYTRVGGSIFFILWPEETRPSAKQEIREITAQLETIGELSSLGTVSYQVPPFEKASLARVVRQANFSREGVLYSLVKQSDTTVPPVHFGTSNAFWRRYRVASYQLALKVNPNEDVGRGTSRFEIDPFILSSTSRRNSEVSHINAWASNNVVARIHNPLFVDRQLRRLMMGVTSIKASEFLEELGLEPNYKESEWGGTWLHRA